MFAIVEIMGHRVRAGMISDCAIGGATLLRIEHPTRAAAFDNNEPETEYYAPAAIFAIRPCSQDEAERVAASCWASREWAPALSAPFADLVDDDYGAEPF